MTFIEFIFFVIGACAGYGVAVWAHLGGGRQRLRCSPGLRSSLVLSGFGSGFKTDDDMIPLRKDRRSPNHPASGEAGIAPQLAIGHRWPGLLSRGVMLGPAYD